jgi:hypothetical protein
LICAIEREAFPLFALSKPNASEILPLGADLNSIRPFGSDNKIFARPDAEMQQQVSSQRDSSSGVTFKFRMSHQYSKKDPVIKKGSLGDAFTPAAG